ncbi:MAG TPA: hypothetical protein VFQ90_20155 [Stellaceae bacterium]|jgi:hypothetical protein|nr:hypothetical protein [Stellaceae bacterium]
MTLAIATPKALGSVTSITSIKGGAGEIMQANKHQAREAAMSLGDVLGCVAAGLVFSTFLARQMTPLRILAIFSNIAFIAYGGLYHLWPIVGLHLSMLPVNVIRLREALGVAKSIIV